MSQASLSFRSLLLRSCRSLRSLLDHLDMRLSMEVTEPDISTRPPQDHVIGVFLWGVIAGVVIYGVYFAALFLGDFTIVL